MRALAVAVASVFLGAGLQQPDPEPDRIVEAARAVMAAARYCALITLDADGAPQARTMEPFPADDDFTVWMATNKSTRKVRELANDPRATLYYLDAQGGAYVTLTGVARGDHRWRRKGTAMEAGVGRVLRRRQPRRRLRPGAFRPSSTRGSEPGTRCGVRPDGMEAGHPRARALRPSTLPPPRRRCPLHRLPRRALISPANPICDMQRSSVTDH